VTHVALSHCANCGRPLDGAYCAECGQKASALNPTLHDFLHDLTHELVHVDGRIVQSVRLLLTRPGFLTHEYFRGRRARYISPIRLYLIFSVLFFLASAAVSTPLSDEDRAELARANPSANLEFASAVEAWLPRTVFALVPVFALVTAAVTRSARRNYPQHLYFAFHVHAALFAIGTLWMLLRFSRSEAMDVVADLLTIAASVWYLVAAFRVAYGSTWRRAAGRAALAGAMYVLAFGATLAILVSLALYA
jgi:hypothetical protein